MMAMTVLQLRLRATLEMTMRRVKRCQNSAALRSFDSVLLFQINHFLTYDVFLRSG